MSKKLTNDEFIYNSNKIHNNIYDYSLINYINNKLKVKILCKIHGLFEQRPNDHLQGKGCFKCSGNEKLTTDEFIKRAKTIHGNTYDYSKVKYKKRDTNVEIICKKHGSFFQRPCNHILSKNGCPKCSGVGKSLSDFIKEAISVHKNKYTYDFSTYSGAEIKTIITCKTHGNFKQTPSSHTQGHGCPRCAGQIRTLEEFIKDSKEIHNNKYIYSATTYQNYYKNTTIACKIHGNFNQSPSNHLRGSGCPICKESIGENKVARFLIKNNIIFERQKTFDDCKNPKTNKHLKFDFYLPDFNLCIEFDGQQHYEPYKFKDKENSIKKFEDVKFRDNIKNKYFKNNNKKLLRISYKDIKKLNDILEGAILK